MLLHQDISVVFLAPVCIITKNWNSIIKLVFFFVCFYYLLLLVRANITVVSNLWNGVSSEIQVLGPLIPVYNMYIYIYIFNTNNVFFSVVFEWANRLSQKRKISENKNSAYQGDIT